MPERQPQQVSFRDPSGSLVVTKSHVLRALNEDGRAEFEKVAALPAWRDLLASGDVVSTRVVGRDEADPVAREALPFEPALLLEHERIAFPTYPYEWPPEMLHAAGLATVRIARRLLTEGIGLKDATPFNVLFRGPKPVFIDVLSFEPRDPGDAIWLAQAQFARTFVLPLLLHKHLGMPPHHHFLASREGIAPEDAYTATGALRRLTPAFLTWVSLPTWMGRASDGGRPARTAPARTPPDPGKAAFILDILFRRLERALNSVAPARGRHSTWSDYESCTHYQGEAARVKETFVISSLDRVRPARVLDIGCNVGRFSRLAAERGASVIAVDLDPVVVGEVWRMADRDRLDILPIIQNVAMPSPATGWWNRECPSFIDRAEGRFDLVLMLALVHHLLVTDRIPLEQVVDLAAHLASTAVVEYVGPDDPMFQKIARGREHLHAGLNLQSFEQAFARRFRTVASQPVPGTGRTIFLFERA